MLTPIQVSEITKMQNIIGAPEAAFGRIGYLLPVYDIP